MTRKRVRQTVIEQLSLRLYAESPRDVWITDALRPLSTGILRATVVEALYEGLQVLQRKGWNIGEVDQKTEKRKGDVRRTVGVVNLDDPKNQL